MKQENNLQTNDFAALVAAQLPDRALEQAFYGDPAVYDREKEKVFKHQWLYVGHASEIANPGQYFVFEIADESVIIVRGQDQIVRALVNVCRHRGSRVCKSNSGMLKAFVCPYHGWSYGLDGGLLRAWAMPKDFDKSAHGLHEITCEVFHGLIFINFNGAENSFDEVHEKLAAALAPFDLEHTKVAFKESFNIAANWKLAVENYDECYHCALAHPDFAKSHTIKLPHERSEALRKELAPRAEKAGLVVGPIDGLDQQGANPGVPYCYDRYALFENYVTGSQDGVALAPLLGSLTEWDGGASNLQMGHTSFLLIYSDHAVVYRFTPLAAQETVAEVIWLVKDTAEEGWDYDVEQLTWLWRVTSEADKEIIERNQAGVKSSYYRPGPYSEMESFCRRFNAWYLKKVA